MKTRTFSLLATALWLLAGCATGPSGLDGGRYAVTAVKAPFYKYGPAQAFGADFALLHGQKVTMVERAFGFSRVMTDDGISGFVATDEIVPSPDPVPAVQPRVTSLRGGVSGTRKKAVARPEPDAGLFNFNDIPLPTKAEPAKKPEVQPPKPDPKPTPKPGA
jgi:hypothetical protein